jgi:hypothetical protein
VFPPAVTIDNTEQGRLLLVMKRGGIDDLLKKKKIGNTKDDIDIPLDKRVAVYNNF